MKTHTLASWSQTFVLILSHILPTMWVYVYVCLYSAVCWWCRRCCCCCYYCCRCRCCCCLCSALTIFRVQRCVHCCCVFAFFCCRAQLSAAQNAYQFERPRGICVFVQMFVYMLSIWMCMRFVCRCRITNVYFDNVIAYNRNSAYSQPKTELPISEFTCKVDFNTFSSII